MPLSENRELRDDRFLCKKKMGGWDGSSRRELLQTPQPSHGIEWAPFGKERDLYNRQKCQLVNSMLLYTTRIISDGMKIVMEGNAPSVLSEVLQSQKVDLLQQEILRTATFPQDFKNTCEQFDLQDFRCPNPLVLFSENGPKQWKPYICSGLYS